MTRTEPASSANSRSGWKVATVALLSFGVLTCGGAGGGTGPQGGAYNVAISPSSLTLAQGQSGTATVSILGRPKGAVSLTVVSVPDNVTATLNPSSLSGSASSSTLTINSTLNVGTGTYNLDVRAADGSGDPSSVGFALTVTLAPGMTVNKAGSGAGTVTSDPAGINCGSTCSAQFPVATPVTLTAAPAAGSIFAGWAGACSGTALTCTFTPVVNNGNSVTATFNSTAPGMALSVSPSPVSVQQGTTATATATITRINGYANPVALTTSAATGITVTANPTSVTGTTSTLTISAGAALAAGNYPVTITATGTGVAQQSVTLPVQVTPSASGGPITFNFASCETSETPIWLAYQSGAGPWTRITPANNAFTFTPAATGGLAVATQDGSATKTEVLYASAAELTSLAIAGSCTYSAPTGSKRATGTWANAGVVSQYRSLVTIGGAVATKTSDFSPSFSLTNVPKGPRDLVASRFGIVTNAVAYSMILRRGTNYANNAQIPNLDFGSAESFVPTRGFLTITSLSDTTSVEASLITANGSSEPYYSANGAIGSGGVRAVYYGLPDTLLTPGDYHSVSVIAAPPGSNGTSFRFLQVLAHAVSTTTTTTLGPQLGPGTAVTTVGTTPSLRLRAQVPAVGTYTSGANAQFQQNANTVSISMTGAYLASAPTTWTLDVPDFSSAGYDANWGLKSGAAVSWSVVAFSALNGNLLPFIGGAPTDGAQLTGAGAVGSSATSSASSLVPLRRRLPR